MRKRDVYHPRWGNSTVPFFLFFWVNVKGKGKGKRGTEETENEGSRDLA
jgi:hypothetical protein